MGHLHNVPTKFLVDTGANVSMVHPSILELLPSSVTIEDSDMNIISANGENISVRGTVQLPCKFGKLKFTHKFVLAEITYAGILGADLLELFDATIDLKHKQLTMNNVTLELMVHNEYGVEQYVYASSTEVIPPQSEKIIHVYTEDRTKKGLGLIESSALYLDNSNDGLVIGRAVVNLEGEHYPVKVMNPGSFPIRISCNTRLSNMTPVLQVAEVGSLTSHSRRSAMTPVMQELYEKNCNELNEDEKAQFREMMIEWQDIFAQHPYDTGYCDYIPHTIDTGDAKPIRQKARRLSPHMRPEVDKCVTDLLEHGIISPSESPWASPIVMVLKPSGKWRFCLDYREINKVTRVDAWPLPRIDESLEALQGNTLFCKLDMASGYYNVAMDSRDKQKTAFTTGTGLYEFNVLPFGLRNAPSAFSRLMENVLAGLHFTDCLIYLDDVCTFGCNFSQVKQRLELIFAAFRKANFKLQPSKCIFFQKQMEYLGFIVSGNGIATDPSKVEKVKNWPVPRTLKQVRGFTGLTSYYRKFIPRYSEKAAPLYHLTKKGVNFVWTDECQIAFDTLKGDLCSPPVLAFPDFSQPFILDTDASGTAIGAVLSQVQDGKERVIAYASRTFSPAERNYSVTRRELLAVIHFVQHFKTYLYGKKFLLRTDHGSLRWLFNFKEPEGQVARWLEILAAYQFDIEHRKGSNHGNGDAMSRYPGRLGKQIAAIQIGQSAGEVNWGVLQASDPDLALLYRLKSSGADKPNGELIGTLSKTGKLYMAQWEQIIMDKGVLYRVWWESTGNRHLVVVPHTKHRDLLSVGHDSVIGGHLGIRKSVEKLRQDFWWIGLKKDVIAYIKSCRRCAQRKPSQKTRRAPLSHKPVGYPMERITMDIKGPLPTTSRGNKYILVISDYFTKFCEAFPMNNQEAETVADILCRHWITRYGVPRQIHTDCGTNFESKLVKTVCQKLGIHKTHTVPYNPKSDGLVERMMKTIGQMLSAYVGEDQLDWDLHVSFIMMAYRASVQESSGYTPNKLLFGRENSTPLSILREPKPDLHFLSIDNYLDKLQEVLSLTHTFVRDHLQQAQLRQKSYYDRNVHGKPYRPGDLVWKAIKRVKRGRTWSLAPHFEGPYIVEEVLSDVNYRIRHVDRTTSVVEHFDHLKPYEKRDETVHSSGPSELTETDADHNNGNGDISGTEQRHSKRVKSKPNRYGDFVYY